MDADWLNAEDVAHQVDQYAQSLMTGDFSFDGFEHSQGEPFGDSLFDSHHTSSSYYEHSRGDDPALLSTSQYHRAAEGAHPPAGRAPFTPLRERDLNVPAYTPPKRIIVEKEKPPKKAKAPVQRRPIDEFPTKNGFRKPLFSYSCLIGLAMRNSEEGELTVSEIYRFLCTHFPFFQEAPSGWKNSVRHNLSLNKCFQKVETPTTDPPARRSCLWRINPCKAEKMAAEITKWRDRCAATINQSMSNPADLELIISGRKGMPPPEDDEQSDWLNLSGGQPQNRAVYIKHEKTGRPESRHGRSSAKSSPAAKQPRVLLRQPKYEPYDPVKQEANTSVHERAARTFDSLLERKKLATVHPRSEEIKQEAEGELAAAPLRAAARPSAGRLAAPHVAGRPAPHEARPPPSGALRQPPRGRATKSSAMPRRLQSPTMQPTSSHR
ncbi:Forkhead box protein N4-like isoform X2 [Aphelenchoides fujianensis]|nr:Forkhead box protein N4-like isoform X2 [Aphelenchoides fujianensis]